MGRPRKEEAKQEEIVKPVVKVVKEDKPKVKEDKPKVKEPYWKNRGK